MSNSRPQSVNPDPACVDEAPPEDFRCNITLSGHCARRWRHWVAKGRTPREIAMAMTHYIDSLPVSEARKLGLD